MRSPKVPVSTEIIRTYDEYGALIDGFFRGFYQLLFIVGRPSLAKSYELEQRLGGVGHLIRGWTAPLQAYIDAYRHRNRPLVFDDAEALWKRPGGRILIRSLTEHRPKKLVQWNSTANELTKAGVPQSFHTTSRIAIVANRFAFGSEEERDAVLDRGHLVLFDPLPLEVHQHVEDWFWCQEIYDHLGERLHMQDSPSARTYLKAWERKEAGGDWKKLIGDVFCHNSAVLLVQALETDPECSAVDERVRKFIDKTGLSRATYYNLKREFRKSDQLNPPKRIDVPTRTLRGTPPSADDVEEEEHDDHSASDRGQGKRRDLDSHGLPPWCEYSDDPNDYTDYADFVADWWKRPQHPEPHESDASEFGGQDELRGDNLRWLRDELRKAIGREDYERAAELRDENQDKEEHKRKDGD